MSSPSAEHERSGLVDQLVEALLSNRHCKLVGHDLVGKTPILRDVAKRLTESQGSTDSDRIAAPTVVLIDLQRRSGRGWQDLGEAFCQPFRDEGFHGVDKQMFAEWRLHDFLSHVLEQNPKIWQLILLLDHVDTLPVGMLTRFAQEFGALANYCMFHPELGAVSVLWCGDENKMVKPISAANFPRITEAYRVSGYSKKDVDLLLSQYEATFNLKYSEEFRQQVNVSTGGHPSLVRRYGDSFMELVITFFQEQMFDDLATVAKQTAEDYVKALLAAVGERPKRRTDVTARLANSTVERISRSTDLLTLVMCMQLTDSKSAPANEFPSVAQEHDDLFIADASNQIRIRGEILQEFVCRFFTFRRLALGFFCWDNDRDTLGKAILCCQLAQSSAEAQSADREELIDKSPTPFLEALSDRLHACATPDDVLNALLLILKYFLNAAQSAVFEVAGGQLKLVEVPANRFVPEFAHEPLRLDHCPTTIQEACYLGRTATDPDSGALAVPMTVGENVVYVVWVEPFGEHPLSTIEAAPAGKVPAMVRTAIHLAEGPLASAVAQYQQAELLQAFFHSNEEDRMQVVNRHKRIELISRKSLADLGRTEANTIGRTCSELFQCQTRKNACLCEFVLKHGRHLREQQKWDFKHPEAWVDLHAWPVFDSSGTPTQVCMVARDNTPSAVAFNATLRLLQAQTPQEVYDVLVDSARAMGFKHGRLYISSHPTRELSGKLVSARCFGHEDDPDLTADFCAGKHVLEAEKERYWYDVYKEHQSGVLCVSADEYAVRPPEPVGSLPLVYVPKSMEQFQEVVNLRDVRTETVIEAGGHCYGIFTADMGPDVKTIPPHHCHALFNLVRMAAQTLVTIDYRNRLQILLKGFRHSVAHPLGAMKTWLEICKSHAEDTRRARVAQIALNQVDELHRLSDNLLACLHGDTRPKQELTTEDVVPLIRQVLESYEILFDKRGIVIDYEGPESAHADVNVSFLQAVLRNLVDNAAKAVQANQHASVRAISVRVIACEDRVVEIAVADTGCGISDDLQGHLLEEGFSGFGSTGVGLPASAFFAEIMNAKLTYGNIENEKRSGAVFRLVFEQEVTDEQSVSS